MRADGWEVIRIGQVTHPPKPLHAPDAPVFSVTKYRGLVSSLEYFGKQVFSRDTSKYNVVPPGAFAYATIHIDEGCIGVSAESAPVLVSPMYTVFEIDERRIDRDFFFRLLKSPTMVARYPSVAQGTVNRRRSVSYSALGTLDIRIPHVDEQRRIATVLQSADVVMESAQAVIDQTEKVKGGLVRQLLTRGMPGVHKCWKQSEIGEVPESWDIALLDEVAERGSGHTPSKSHPEYWDGGIKWVSLKDSSKLDHVFISTTQANISELGIENSSAVVHPSGTVVLSRDAGVGKSAVMTAPMAVSQHFMAWRCGPRLHNMFLYYLLQKMKPQFDAAANGSTIKTIGLGYFKKLLLPVPPLEEQRAIAAMLLAHDEASIAAERTWEQAAIVRQGLANDLLSGRVRVPG